MGTNAEQAPSQKSKQRHTKRKEVQDENGWTVISHTSAKPSRRRRNVPSNVLDQARPKEMVQGLTVAKLTQEFSKMMARWKNTECAVATKRLLGSRAWHIEGAVCIGIGSFSLDWENRHRALWQLILFVDIMSWISVKGERRAMAMYAQDPIFTPLDVEFLSTLDHPVTVLENDIQEHITPKTFVFAPFVDWALLLPTFINEKDPVLYVGNEVLADYRVFAVDDKKERECAAIGKRFLDGRETCRIPDLEAHGSALQGLVAHWKSEGGSLMEAS